jgi:hypothetical protein
MSGISVKQGWGSRSRRDSSARRELPLVGAVITTILAFIYRALVRNGLRRQIPFSAHTRSNNTSAELAEASATSPGRPCPRRRARRGYQDRYPSAARLK